MDIDADKLDKMKVAELRALLSSHDLDTKGTKPVLVARLKDFLASQEEEKAEEEEAEEETPAEAEPEKAEEEAKPAEEAAPVVEETKEEPVAEAAKPEEKMETDEAPKEAPAKEEEKADAATTSAQNNANQRGIKRKREDEPFQVNEDEPEIPEDYLCLDWMNSDLTFKINRESFAAAEPFHVAAWGYIFSSARATHGFTSGKVAFEVKWVGNMEVKLEDVKEPHELRVGFSTDDSNLQAGESPLSFAYSNFAKKAKDSTFEEFGATFTKDDVVTAMLDMDSNNVTISFAKNGEVQGEAFTFAKADLEGKALFPHVSSRNVKLEVNFGKNKDGSEKEKFSTVPEGYVMAADCLANAHRGMARIAKREDCEMIMLIGLPASGKSTWTSKHVAENVDKRFNVIGTSTLIDRMKVDGEPRKKHMTGKWDTLISKLTKCVQDMLRLASQRRRNFIIDQTNVFANAQKRKVRPFEGMTRKAVVIVPSEEDFKARTEAQEKAECKDVPDNAVMEMKANFALPEEAEDSPFKEIIFTELQREEAAKIVAEYNKDAKEKGFGKKQEMPQKKRRGNFMRHNMRGGRMQRGRPGPMGRGGPRGMFRGGFPPRGMMRGGPNMRHMGPMHHMHMGNRGGMGPNRGMGQRGGPMQRPPFRGGRGGGHGGPGMQGKMGGGPSPWGSNPSPWQQPPRPQNQGWGGGNNGGMWNQGGGQMNSPWGGNNGGMNRGGGGGHYGGGHQGGWNNSGNQGYGFGNNQGYPGSQNWGGFR